MNQASDSTVLRHFSRLSDPRVMRTRKHSLHDILVLAICGFLCGIDDWVNLEFFANTKLKWFKTFLELPNGVPSHDTFGKVFAALDPEAFSRCFSSWTAAIATATDGQVIAIDGKTIRRSMDRAAQKAAIHMVSAWASDNRLVLGQVKTEEKSNEITAIPKLLEMLALQGCIVTIDAMGCQKEIVQDIVDKGGDYVIAVKENQPLLLERIQGLFEGKGPENLEVYEAQPTVEKDHGRIETRRCFSAPVHWMKSLKGWANLMTVVKVVSERSIGSEISIDVRYFISSLPAENPDAILVATRKHWSIENDLHWTLDMAFREDESRMRKDNAAENAAMLRHIALNLLKSHTHVNFDGKRIKGGVATRRRVAGWDHDYLLALLGFNTGRI